MIGAVTENVLEQLYPSEDVKVALMFLIIITSCTCMIIDFQLTDTLTWLTL